MEWVSFIPSVVAGGIAGLFIARSRFWKAKYHQEKSRWETENSINRTEIKSLHSSLLEYREAYEDLQAKATSQPYQSRGVKGMHPVRTSEQISDEMIMEMMLKRIDQPTQHVIQEEP
jgi:hypothetical protein